MSEPLWHPDDRPEDISSAHMRLAGHWLRDCPGSSCPAFQSLIAAENSDLPEIESGYEDAPKWYWRIAGRFPGWRGDANLWLTLLLAGVALGVFVGGCAAIVGFLTV